MKDLKQRCEETGINYEHALQVKANNPNSSDEQIIKFCEQQKTFAENCLESADK